MGETMMVDPYPPEEREEPLDRKMPWVVRFLAAIASLPRRFDSLSLRTRLFVILLLLTMIPVGFMAFINDRSTRSAINQASLQTLVVAASQTATRIDAWIASKMESVQENSSALELSQYLSLAEEKRYESKDSPLPVGNAGPKTFCPSHLPP
jgi:hypothetical protein